VVIRVGAPVARVHNPTTLQVAASGALVSIAVFGVRGVELLRAHYAHEARACIGEEEAQLIREVIRELIRGNQWQSSALARRKHS
jgi:hypothetical protein